jgi:hypothetical protein
MFTPTFALSAEPTKSDADLQRESAIADFTAKMKAANYPSLFDKAAQEFNVPADILKGISFAETRWYHLTWPPGETVSPETGMPRPYGIMSLQDNNYFGHSLIEAARVIGKDPQELKDDPLQNIRGAAALLRKTYDETPKPPGNTEADIESWRYAIRKYTGIPQPELNAKHALKVYTFMNEGFHQYGIEWNAHPVNLDPIREETRRIVAEEQQKRETQLALFPKSRTNSGTASRPTPGNSANQSSDRAKIPNGGKISSVAAGTNDSRFSEAASPPVSSGPKFWWMLGAIALLSAVVGLLIRQKRNR